MKKLLIVITLAAIMLIGATVAYAAAAAKTPAEIISGLTGNTVEQVQEARQDGKTYGAQAVEANKLDEFKAQRLEQYKLALDEAVKEKRLTQPEADKLYETMKSRMDNCTGNGNGCGQGNGCGNGGRQGFGRGNGMGKMGGNCIAAN